MLEMLSEFARDFARIDSSSMTILLVMVGWSALVIHIAVESKSYTALFIPGMVLGGMAAFYLARKLVFTMAGTKDINAIMLSAFGMVAGFLVTVLVFSAIHWIRELRRPLTLDNRT